MNNLTVHIEKTAETLVKNLAQGISLPILDNLIPYVLETFKTYDATGLYLHDEQENLVGQTILCSEDEILFFGYFRVDQDDETLIKALLDSLLEYAKENGFSKIRGPLNIPTFIYGWGFMKEGSSDSHYICCPANPPIYQELFWKGGFKTLFEEDRYAMRLFPLDLKKMYPDKDFDPYQYMNPADYDDLIAWKDDFLRLHKEFMPPSAQIAPKPQAIYKTFAKFLSDMKCLYLVYGVQHKPSKEMIPCGYCLPNVFALDEDGNLNSASFHDWVVHKDHQRNGIAMFMWAKAVQPYFAHGIKSGSWPVAADNKANSMAAKKMGGKKDRTHYILEYTM